MTMRFHARLALTLSIVGLSGVIACGGQVEHEAPLALASDPPSTDGDVALRNLGAQISGLTRVVARQPGALGLHSQLSGLLLSRAAYEGSFSDFDTSLALAQAASDRYPESAEAALMEADALQATHAFHVANEWLTLANALGAETRALEATIDLALHRNLERRRDEAAAITEEAPTFGNLAQLAAFTSALGDFDAADELYLRALEAYRDVSPFPYAFVAFQRGVMWGEAAGRPDRARLLYEEAVRRVPGYVVANVHLAELEWEAGDTGQAIARLRRVAHETEDPEPRGLLAEILADEGMEEEAATLRDEAASMYDALLARHPLAFADHAAEFFSGPGDDIERARTLAERNLANRPNPRAYIVAIETARPSRACELTAPASALADSHPALAEVIDEALTHCD